MNILAFDTSSAVCSAAIQYQGDIKSLQQDAPMQQGQLILPMIQNLLDAFSITLSQLDAIAYGAGPGSFTGIRLASSVAQGLAFALNLPVIPVSSMAAIAQAVYLDTKVPHLLIALDARMNQVYWAAYQMQKELVLLGSEAVCLPTDVPLPETIDLQRIPWQAIGEGWAKYRLELTACLASEPGPVKTSWSSMAEAVLILAKQKFARSEWVTAADAMPVYLR